MVTIHILHKKNSRRTVLAMEYPASYGQYHVGSTLRGCHTFVTTSLETAYRESAKSYTSKKAAYQEAQERLPNYTNAIIAETVID